MSAAWSDTRAQPLPALHDPWLRARWLVGRYPRIQVLCERVGAVDDDEGERWPHVNMLADIICASDAYNRAWERYRLSHYEPTQREGESDQAYEARGLAWVEAGPHPAESIGEFNLATPHGVRAYGPMSGGEKRMLRILAAAGTHRVEFCRTDLDGLDAEGEAFVRDWCAILAP